MPTSNKEIREQNLVAIESARESARQLAETAKEALETTERTMRAAADTATQTIQRAADQFGRTLGISGQHGEELARQSTRNLTALTECGTVLARGLQEIATEWMSLAQHRLQKNLEGFEAFAGCRTMQDLVAAQTQFVRDNVQEIVDNSRHIAETSVRVANEAAQTFAGSAKNGQSRLKRVA